MRDITHSEMRQLLLVLALCSGHVVWAQTYENRTQLKTTLLTGYDTQTVPKNNQSEALAVNISVYLYGIVEINAVEGSIKLTASVSCQWVDERMVWNASDYGGIATLNLLQDTVWKPLLAVSQPVEMMDIGEKWMAVRYFSNGNAAWNPYNVFSITCGFNVRYWPFDKQICYFSIFLYNDYPSEVLLQTFSDGALLLYYTANSEWDLEDTFLVNKVYPYTSEVYLGLQLRRQATFYTLTIILPLLALNVMNAFVFLLPSEAGDRIGFTITVMLAITVFLLLIGDHVPKTSDPMPLICGFVIFIVALSVMCLVLVILLQKLYYCEGNIPERSWVRKLVSMISCSKQEEEICEANNLTQEKHSQDRVNTAKFGNKVDSENNSNMLGIKSKSFLAEQPESTPVSWNDACKAFDRVCFIFFLVTTALGALIFPVYIAAASEYPDKKL